MPHLLALEWWPFGSGVTAQVLFFLDLGLRLFMAGVVIMRRRPVPTTLAWLVLVLSLPFIGSFLYLLVGETRLGAKRRLEYEQLTTEVEPIAVARWWEQKLTAKPPLVQGGVFDQVARDATALGGFPPLIGNRLELIGDTDELLRRLARDIDNATSHAHLNFYIWMDGGLAREVVAALVRAAKRGVDCKVLADSVGSKNFLRGNAPRELREAGVKVHASLPVNPLRGLVARLDLRNHRKLAVIDGCIAYCGSQNLTDTTFHFKKRHHVGPWIDASVRMHGPAVQALAVSFLRDWAMEEDEAVRLEDRYFPPASGVPAGDAIVQVVPTGPGPDVVGMRESLLNAMHAARREMIITTPYFVPDDATLAAITGAGRRGVQTTLVVPKINDSRLVAAASRSHFQELLDAGVRVLWFRDGLLHSKTLTIDGGFSMIGSANIDMRSFWLNFEITLFVYDEPFARELRALQAGYIDRADEIQADRWRRRPIHSRGFENLIRLFGPVL